MRLDLFDYNLPEDRIAVTPSERRDESRLMVLHRGSGDIAHRRFRDLPRLLRRGDLLVMNNARVLPARLHGKRETGGAVELLLVRRLDGEGARWEAMLRAGGRPRPGEVIRVGRRELPITLEARHEDGAWDVDLGDEEAEKAALAEGAMPLPPYITRSRRRRGMPENMPDLDRDRYQTVYAAEPGAVAAPTAGLHFTEDLLDEVSAAGVETAMLSLLVGPGTFRPVRKENIEDHELEAEYFRLPADTADAVREALAEDMRIVATGTTSCRVLEHVAREGKWRQCEGWADLFIYPPYRFRAVGALITNFHLPRSTLLMLVAAFAGRETILAAYEEAVREGYRFYSYGDAMLIL